MISVRHSIDRLAADMADIPVQAQAKFADAVAGAARGGNALASEFARESSGRHGVHYPDSFDAEQLSPFEWEYGPDASKLQGGMSFEFGSRNQPPHLDLAQSADVAGEVLEHNVADAVDSLFW